jgi:hypothetical protein
MLVFDNCFVCLPGVKFIPLWRVGGLCKIEEGGKYRKKFKAIKFWKFFDQYLDFTK